MSSSSSHTPFLSDTERNDDFFDESQDKHSFVPKRSARIGSVKLSAILFHTIMIFVYIVLTIAFIKNKPPQRLNIVYTPVGNSLEYIAQTIPDSPEDVGTSRYVGMESSPELDNAWYQLLRHHNIRLTDDDLRGINQSSISLGHGGGYLGMLGVYHELHCLKLVREALHLDYYGRGKSEKQKRILAGHAEHCVDALRQTAMCRADTTIFPYHWNNFTRTPAPTWVQTHECVNWDKFTQWLDSRVVDIHEPGLLTHPTFGPSYPTS
ncbi:uncharacterized protein K452DRAFT_360469 [Aplosporella prunicola CBS 121167]|uniref:DUF3328 domain-containing protein n=1 Tax=Aplosporella prunicola CBS 121167 TaxID=1176127 RepID=A0A6A6BA30_9PEZI|nr:uncharacterized protein K452DRAFT_360469 [Aplosporella prunicola CBS 121167]KAF2139767.1 hypothetical protein K452DRAFT_360469 [Aplosporella prunicola CBS 121167]